MKVFSFCLYGTEPNYYTGLLDNISIIREFFPDFDIVVAKGVCDPSWTIPEGVSVVETGLEGAVNMLYRYVPMATAEVGFVRDTDSRITERDRWCIRDFLDSPYTYHMIRDHVWHRSPLMGGLFGWKRPTDIGIEIPTDAGYGTDERLLSSHLYPRIVSELLVHTNIYGLHRENTRRMPAMSDPTDFVGNVLWNGEHRFRSVPNPLDLVGPLRGQDQFELIRYVTDSVDPHSVPYQRRTEFFDTAYIANYYLGDFARAQYWLSQFEFAEITPHVEANSGFLLQRMGTLIASFDATIVPGEGEVMIYYGNYPAWHLALPCSNRIYRHISRFFEVAHDKVLYHPAWEPVGCIYILNLEERVDRYYETLLTLASVGAPLHRVHHYKATRDGLPPYVGATKNHVDVLRHMCASSAAHALILEDDFVFLDDRETVWATLSNLWTADPSYTLCFASLSRTGRREHHTDLTSRTHQPCTTSSGYFVRRETAPAVLKIADEGLQRMQETGDHHTYCIDRYWTSLPDILVLRPKIGFQRPSYSNLIRNVSAHLD